MKVTLVKQDVAEFNLQVDKCEKISHKLFRSLTNFECKKYNSTTPKVVAFTSKEDYLENACKYDLDLEKEMFINGKGHIFCFLADEQTAESEGDTNETESTDESTDSQEDKAE